jgi:hypothetical protein
MKPSRARLGQWIAPAIAITVLVAASAALGGQRTGAPDWLTALNARSDALNRQYGLGEARAGSSAAQPARLFGTWDDVESGKELSMSILRPGHPFCTRLVKTQQACSRTLLGGGSIGAVAVVSGDRLALPERYRSASLGSLCLDMIPVYRVPQAGSRLQLALVGYRTRAGEPVRATRVSAADCVPPKLWQHRGEERQLQAARKALDWLGTVEMAQAAGYVVASPCIPGEGVHYITQSLAQDAVVEPSRPELLIYAVGADRRLRLVAAEYWKADADGNKATTGDRPTLFGHPFDGPMDGHAPGMPVHYDLHVWLFKENPKGLFTAQNPTVGCPALPG